jgi:hypothetical protein
MVWQQPQLTNPPMGPTDEIKLLQHRLLHAYNGHSLAQTVGVVESGIFDAATDVALRNQQTYMDGKTVTGGVFHNTQPGVLTYATKLALGVVDPPPPPEPACVYFSINGAGSTWNMGYPFDIGETLDKSKVWHQPIGYNTNPFPMADGVKDGVAEFIRQLDMPRGRAGKNCTQLPWTYNFYSMGAIVGMTVMMRIFDGDLQRFKATCMGGSTFGNPMRQHGHTFPGCSYSDGEGIVTPNAHDCPDAHWDMACDKAMTGSTGDDLYTKLDKTGVDDQTDVDMRAVWDIVNTANPMNLAQAVLLLLAKPSFNGGYDAAVAAFQALDFFAVKNTSPHVQYQFTQPIDGDARDCWELCREHAADLVARLPVDAWAVKV